MSKSVYVINPRADFPTYWGAEMLKGWGFEGASAIADLACVTVAGLVPEGFEVRVCDENIGPVDWASQADFVAITGKVSQWGRMRAIARRFRKLGKTVIIGGPYASLCPDVVAEECDVIFRGELEEVAPELFSDLGASSWKDEYIGTVPSLDVGPLPRWDLYPNDRALIGSVQTSRGCPFECDFCDVIQYLGRRQRHKSIPRVLAELDQVYRLGYRTVFLVDDNFTSSRKRCKELLIALAEWNERQDEKTWFFTQLSIDAARDDELLLLLARAGLTYAFIGLETPNQESLSTLR